MGRGAGAVYAVFGPLPPHVCIAMAAWTQSLHCFLALLAFWPWSVASVRVRLHHHNMAHGHLSTCN